MKKSVLKPKSSMYIGIVLFLWRPHCVPKELTYWFTLTPACWQGVFKCRRDDKCCLKNWPSVPGNLSLAETAACSPLFSCEFVQKKKSICALKKRGNFAVFPSKTPLWNAWSNALTTTVGKVRRVGERNTPFSFSLWPQNIKQEMQLCLEIMIKSSPWHWRRCIITQPW